MSLFLLSVPSFPQLAKRLLDSTCDLLPFRFRVENFGSILAKTASYFNSQIVYHKQSLLSKVVICLHLHLSPTPWRELQLQILLIHDEPFATWQSLYLTHLRPVNADLKKSSLVSKLHLFYIQLIKIDVCTVFFELQISSQRCKQSSQLFFIFFVTVLCETSSGTRVCQGSTVMLHHVIC